MTRISLAAGAAHRSTGALRSLRSTRHFTRLQRARPQLTRARLALRWLLLSAGVILIAACSSLRIGYNNADTLLSYTLNSYLDLDEAQQRIADTRIRELLAWHRSTRLPEYVRFIDSARARLDGTVDTQQVLTFQLGFNERLAAIGQHAAPAIVELALTLRPQQIDRLDKKLARDWAPARREVAHYSGPDAVGERARLYAERAEQWFGTLTDEQHALIHASLTRREGGDAWWLEERALRQRELVAGLRRIQSERPAPAVAARWVQDYLLSLRQPADPERLQRIREWRAGNAELVAQLINSAAPVQRERLIKKLHSYSNDMSALAAESERRT
jgi:hypothetical protein